VRQKCLTTGLRPDPLGELEQSNRPLVRNKGREGKRKDGKEGKVRGKGGGREND